MEVLEGVPPKWCYNIPMSTWATRRKLLYSSISFFFLALIILGVFWYAYPAPTCSDGKRNQNEQGVDCGGSCSKVCSASTEPLRVLWTRPFSVAPGVANAAAFVLNPNSTLGATKVNYRLRLYDDQNILIAERRGSTRVPVNEEFPIFEGGIAVGNRLPTRAFLEFLSEPDWVAYKGVNTLSIRNQHFDENNLSLEADVFNPEVDTVRSVEAYGIIFGEDGNAIGASKTVIDRIPGGGSTHIVFTWPSAFSTDPVSENIYLINSFAD